MDKDLGAAAPAAAPQSLPDDGVLQLPRPLLDLLPIGVYACDRNGLIVRYNRAAAEMWGREPKLSDAAERYTGAWRTYCLDGGPQDPADSPMARALASGEAIRNQETVIERPDGSQVVTLVTVDMLRDEDGVVAGAVCCFRDVSDYRRTQNELRHAERRARHLIEALPVAVYATDAEGRITFYNEAAADLWGCRPEIGRSEFCGSWKLYHMDGRPMPHDTCPMATCLREGREIRGAEAIAERPDGSRVAFMPFPTRLHDGAGRCTGGVNVLIDITDRKRAEAGLAERAREQQALFEYTDRLYREATPEGIYEAALDAIQRCLGCARASILLFDAGGTMRFVAWRGLSDHYRRTLEGHSPWALGARDPEPVTIEDIESAAEPGEVKAAIRAEGIGALAFVPLTVDGAVIGKFMAYYDAPRAFAPHEIDLALLIARQLGFSIQRRRGDEARHAAEAALANERQLLGMENQHRRRAEVGARRLAAIVESSDDAILAMDLDGTITSWNGGAERLFGYGAAEVVGRSVTMLIPEDRHDEEPAILARIARGERIGHYETIRRRKDGSLVDVSLAVSPILGPDGEVVGASKIARDISERRRAQEQQQLLMREMNHRIKNLFAIAGGLVLLSSRNAATPAELATAVRGRLGALAKAHDLTLAKPWDAASPSTGGATSFFALLRTILSPYEARGDGEAICERLVLRGEDFMLCGQAVTGFALILHEFATNAAKYGALSVPDGMIAVDCADDGERHTIVWTEHGLPATPPAETEGFGSQLVRSTVQTMLGGEFERRRQADGLVLRLVLMKHRMSGAAD